MTNEELKTLIESDTTAIAFAIADDWVDIQAAA